MDTTSERATARISDMREEDMPVVERFRIVANQFVEADGKASLSEEMKTTTLEQMKSNLIAEQGPMADNKAERIIKSSPDWEAYITNMVDLRNRANKLKYQLEWLRMVERAEDRHSWLQRTEHKMGRSAT